MNKNKENKSYGKNLIKNKEVPLKTIFIILKKISVIHLFKTLKLFSETFFTYFPK